MKVSKDALRSARQMLRLTMVDGVVDGSRARHCVKKVGDAKPRGYLAILQAYLHLLRLELEKRHAVVQTVSGLDARTRGELEADLKKKYGDDLTFEYFSEPTLLGGMRVKVGSDVWDGSVKARLQQLREVFND